MDNYRVTVTFIEPLLGTVPGDPEIYETWATQPDVEDEEVEEELLTLPDKLEKGTTGFHRLDETPALYDYVVKGFFKDACGMLRRVPKTASSKIRAYRKIIDGLVFVKPRLIPIQTNGGEITFLERPLRAQTAQGERVALARSECCPSGSSITFKLLILGEVTEDLLREWLEYGALRGLGQWRNGGYGAFEYELEKLG